MSGTPALAILHDRLRSTVRSPSRTGILHKPVAVQVRSCVQNAQKYNADAGRHNAARAVRPCFNVCACAHGTAASAGARSAGALRPPCFPAPSYRAGPTCAIGNLRNTCCSQFHSNT